MAMPRASGEVVVGVPVVTASVAGLPAISSSSYDDSAFSTAAALLKTGVRVVVRWGESGTGGVRAFGMLSLAEDRLEFTTRSTRTKTTTTMISSIRVVGLQQHNTREDITTVCRVELNAGEPGLSFSFACRDDTNGLTSLELTELAARVMQERFGLAPRNIVGLIENGYRMTSFAELLRPLGLIDTYLSAFQEAGVRFENLGLVTRSDLANLMSITRRVDQINISGLIKRHFRGAPPGLHPTGFDRSRQEYLGAPVVGAHLATGLRVVARHGGLRKGGVRDCGMISLTGACLVYSVQRERGGANGATNTITISSIRGVQIEHETGGGSEGNTVCLTLKDGSSFNFFCRDAANGLSSSEVTKLVGLILRQRLSMSPDEQGALVDQAHLITPFVELLEPLGLVDKYCRAFAESGVHFENLGVVTRDDLEEVMGVIDGADQINILGQIERHFQEAPPTLQTCTCNCRREKPTGRSTSGLSGSNLGTAMESFADMVEASSGF